MNIAVCDDQAEELETVTELLRQWQAQRRCPLHFRTFRSAAQLLDAARRERFTLRSARRAVRRCRKRRPSKAPFRRSMWKTVFSSPPGSSRRGHSR